MKLYIDSSGDWTVGIFGAVYELDCPFDESDKDDKQMLDAFKEDMLSVYKQWVDFRVTAYYDFEREE